jgi:hypothetical protein
MAVPQRSFYSGRKLTTNEINETYEINECGIVAEQAALTHGIELASTAIVAPVVRQLDHYDTPHKTDACETDWHG